ncbi:hypothetical protein [Pengzhenrongella sp.]|uniref:hypothetical protein n=1 Tax=Pengzhenrongella sp. TaxID=2888820 RepID=UPI002F95B5C4
MSQRFTAAAVKGPGNFSAHDATGMVAATVTGEGRLKDVRVATAWRTKVEPTAVGAAVVEAYSAARLNRLEQFGTGFAEGLDEAPPSTRPMPSFSESFGAKLDEVMTRGSTSRAESDATLEAMAAFVREINDSIDSASADVAALQRSQVTGRSARGRVHLQLSGDGEVQRIQYDATWLERAHVANIGRETLVAQDDALRLLAGRSVADVLAASDLGRLQALASDPRALAERLRLRR